LFLKSVTYWEKNRLSGNPDSLYWYEQLGFLQETVPTALSFAESNISPGIYRSVIYAYIAA
jgi:hypothetical protein